MRFISHGDYLLPLHFPSYLAQHLYVWSYERGATNPDGILRLPARLIDIVVFALAGNLAFGYFYLVSCIVVAFLAFFWFARRFLETPRLGVIALGSLFFALNPIFLGNMSKVGLILAASMLPVMLTALKQGLANKRVSYFLLFVLALNVSLLHPFTFVVNLLACLIYLSLHVRQHMVFIRDNVWKIGFMAIIALALNAYCILPLISLGTLDKGALSDTVSTTATDYTGLVDVANTGDIFTGLSLAKGVLKDYEFFGPLTWPFYFLGVFLFYALLFGMYVRIEGRAKPRERRRFMWFLGIFLALLVLATASYLYADVFIKFLIGLPGGWMFRSPLKWQLYMPLVLFAALVIALKHISNGWRLKMLYLAFLASFVLMNGYLFVQIYQRLLTPRAITYFSALEQTDLNRKNLMFADSATCATFARDNPAIATELNEVLISKPVQVKHVQASQLDTVNLGQYDFVLGCGGTFDQTLLTNQYAYALKETFAKGTYQLFQNQRPTPYISAATQIFGIADPQDLGGKYALAEELQQPFIFVDSQDGAKQATDLQDIFEIVTPKDIRNGQIKGRLYSTHNDDQQLIVKGNQSLYYAVSGHHLKLSATPGPGLEQYKGQPVALNTARELEVSYRDESFSYKNQIGNPSLEQGLWQSKVGDCNAYDNQANIFMNLDRQEKSAGRQSLELGARSHIACTGPDAIAVKPGEHYLLSFDYRASADRIAGFYIGFNDRANSSITERLSVDSDWKTLVTEVVVPDQATSARLMFYAYPTAIPGQAGIAHYDNFAFIQIPEVTNRFFTLSGRMADPGLPPQLSFTTLNPTKSLLSIKRATKPFYLATKETYHDLWKLSLNNGHSGLSGLVSNPASLAGHMLINGTMNGWQIDPATLCATPQPGCTRNSDGSYNLLLAMEFSAQRWFYLGSFISAIAAMLAVGFVLYEVWCAKWKGMHDEG
jgi:hypothetical protein